MDLPPGACRAAARMSPALRPRTTLDCKSDKSEWLASTYAGLADWCRAGCRSKTPAHVGVEERVPCLEERGNGRLEVGWLSLKGPSQLRG